jgi:hypothetical protein
MKIAKQRTSGACSGEKLNHERDKTDEEKKTNVDDSARSTCYFSPNPKTGSENGSAAAPIRYFASYAKPSGPRRVSLLLAECDRSESSSRQEEEKPGRFENSLHRLSIRRRRQEPTTFASWPPCT